MEQKNFLKEVNVKSFLSLIIFLIFLIFSCTTNPEDDLSIENYMPLAVGNSWTYEDRQQSRHTWEIAYKDGSVYACSVQGTVTYWEIVDTEIHEWMKSNPNSPEVILQEPLETGHKWPINAIPFHIIIETDFAITLFEKTYTNCIKVMDDDSNYRIFSPNVGIIEWGSLNNPLTSPQKLVLYKVY